jgi:hypothetical protein
MVKYTQIHIRINKEDVWRQFAVFVAAKYGTTYYYLGEELCLALESWLEKNDCQTSITSPEKTHTHIKSGGINQDKRARVEQIKTHLTNYHYRDVPERVLKNFILKTGISDERVVKSYIVQLMAEGCIELKKRGIYLNLLYQPEPATADSRQEALVEAAK